MALHFLIYFHNFCLLISGFWPLTFDVRMDVMCGKHRPCLFLFVQWLSCGLCCGPIAFTFISDVDFITFPIYIYSEFKSFKYDKYMVITKYSIYSLLSLYHCCHIGKQYESGEKPSPWERLLEVQRGQAQELHSIKQISPGTVHMLLRIWRPTNFSQLNFGEKRPHASRGRRNRDLKSAVLSKRRHLK